MSGRFFAMPFLVAADDRGPGARRAGRALGGRRAAAVQPAHPDRADQDDGVATTRRGRGARRTASRTSAATTTRAPTSCSSAPSASCPTSSGCGRDSASGTSAEKVTIQGSIGFYGLYAGPTKFLIDETPCPTRCWRGCPSRRASTSSSAPATISAICPRATSSRATATRTC